MSCLCEDFDHWTNSEPEEIESQHPTEDEMAAFEEAEKRHKEQVCIGTLQVFFADDIPLTSALQFALLEQRGQRLSATLGVGKITDKLIKGSILGFAREGVRFAFSTAVRGQEEELPLGTRLPFLRIVSK